MVRWGLLCVYLCLLGIVGEFLGLTYGHCLRGCFARYVFALFGCCFEFVRVVVVWGFWVVLL